LPRLGIGSSGLPPHPEFWSFWNVRTTPRLNGFGMRTASHTAFLPSLGVSESRQSRHERSERQNWLDASLIALSRFSGLLSVATRLRESPPRVVLAFAWQIPALDAAGAIKWYD